MDASFDACFAETLVYFGVGWNRRDVGMQAKALEMFAASQKTAA